MEDERLSLKVTAFTHRGAVRPANEDSVAVGHLVSAGSMNTPVELALNLDHPIVCLVADGLGGHTAGIEASQYVAKRLSESSDALKDEDSLTTELRAIHDGLRQRMDIDATTEGMATTVAGLLMSGTKAVVFNVGDSRAYRQQDGFLRQLTVDDRPEVKLHRPALGTRETGLVTQALGAASSASDVRPHVSLEELAAGRSYLVCSDGLTDAVGLDEMEAALSEEDGAVQHLFELAMRAGGDDNISILLVRVESALPSEWGEPPVARDR
jgi:serine/threonine protein phosphatase PrpC